MPYKFQFKNQNGNIMYECELKSQQCIHHGLKGRCKNRVVMGLPRCWIHTLQHNSLRVLPSTLPHAGKGLFVKAKIKPNESPNKIIFKKGDFVAEYGGKLESMNRVDRNYGIYTAPYGVSISSNLVRDAACERGIGSMINHQPESKCNCRFSVNYLTKKCNIKATKNIRNGSELFVNYNKSYRFNEPTTHITKPFTRRKRK